MAKKKVKEIKKTKSTAKFHTVFGFKWLQFLAGVLVSAFGVHEILSYPARWTSGFTAQIIALLLIYFSFPRQADVIEYKDAEIIPPAKSPRSNIPLVVLLVLPTLMIIAQLNFRASSLDAGWFFALAAVVLAVWIQLRRPVGFAKIADPVISAELWFWVIMLGVIILRLCFVWTNVTGLQGDEANNLSDTIGIGNGSFDPYRTSWGGTPTFPYYFYVIFFKIFGAQVWVSRLVSTIASVIAIGFFYRWSRFWFSPLASLLGTFWLGISWWFFYFSLSPFQNALLILQEVAAFYFMEKGFREGKRWDFCWSGIFAAMCVMNYVSGRGVPAMLFGTILGYTLIRRGSFIKAYWKQLVLMVASFFWFVMPALIYAIQHPNEVWGRVQPGWIAKEAQHSGSYFFLVKSYFLTLSSLWNISNKVDSRFIAPGLTFLDPFTSAFVLLGLGICVLCLIKFKSLPWVLLPGLFVGLSANALARLEWPTDLAYVQSVRLSIVIPFIFMMACWGFDWFLKIFRSFKPAGWGWIGAVLLTIVIGSSLLNEPVLINRFGTDQATWGEHGFSQIEISKIIMDNSATHHFMFESDIYSNVAMFLALDKTHLTSMPQVNFDTNIPILLEAKKNVMLITETWRISEKQKEKVKHYYPRAVWKEYPTPWNETFLYVIDIPLDEIISAQKGKKLVGSFP